MGTALECADHCFDTAIAVAVDLWVWVARKGQPRARVAHWHPLWPVYQLQPGDILQVEVNAGVAPEVRVLVELAKVLHANAGQVDLQRPIEVQSCTHSPKQRPKQAMTVGFTLKILAVVVD